jgi:hypothetical protein
VAAAARAESTPVLKEKSVSPTPPGTGTHFLLCVCVCGGGGGIAVVDKLLHACNCVPYKNTIFLYLDLRLCNSVG